MAEGADLVRKVDGVFVVLTLQSRLGDLQLHSELESLGLLGTNADQGRNRGIGAQFQAEFLGSYRESASKASCIPTSEKFLRVGALTAYDRANEASERDGKNNGVVVSVILSFEPRARMHDAE